MMDQSRRPKPRIERMAPPGSGRSAVGFFEFGTNSTAPTNAAMTMGTLTRKMEPHQNRASNKPPAMGPMAMPRPMVPPQAPMAFALSLGSRNTSLMMESDEGMVRAAPAPITARKAISRSTEPDRAAPIDPAAKTASPMRKNRFRPNRSAKLPPT